MTNIIHNVPLLIALAACIIAQVSKIFTYRFKEKNWKWQNLFSSGGMPSTHTALVSGLTTGIAISEGFDSSSFALSAVISLVVMYDAMGVRLHAGIQANVLNTIISEMPLDHPVHDNGTLHDTLGHTPLQVFCGLLIGVFTGCLYILLLN